MYIFFLEKSKQSLNKIDLISWQILDARKEKIPKDRELTKTKT
jgi:hypothetical protein